MSRYDGLIIPRSYNEYINKTDPVAMSQALQLSGVMDNVPTENSVHPVKSGGIKTAIDNAVDAVETSLAPVDTVTENNMHSVTSNAVFNAFGKISAQQVATIVPSRFAPDYAAYCRWWRCGRIVAVSVYTGGVYCKIAAAEIIFTGLPKPISNSFPRAILNWGGQNSNADAIYYIDNQGNLLIMGGSSYTDTVIYGEGSFMYVTSDD